MYVRRPSNVVVLICFLCWIQQFIIYGGVEDKMNDIEKLIAEFQSIQYSMLKDGEKLIGKDKDSLNLFVAILGEFQHRVENLSNPTPKQDDNSILKKSENQAGIKWAVKKYIETGECPICFKQGDSVRLRVDLIKYCAENAEKDSDLYDFACREIEKILSRHSSPQKDLSKETHTEPLAVLASRKGVYFRISNDFPPSEDEQTGLFYRVELKSEKIDIEFTDKNYYSAESKARQYLESLKDKDVK
jgi:hypothetical protein